MIAPSVMLAMARLECHITITVTKNNIHSAIAAELR
jgi:hypothetical protein